MPLNIALLVLEKCGAKIVVVSESLRKQPQSEGDSRFWQDIGNEPHVLISI
jgi:hypothetical protein